MFSPQFFDREMEKRNVRRQRARELQRKLKQEMGIWRAGTEKKKKKRRFPKKEKETQRQERFFFFELRNERLIDVGKKDFFVTSESI